MTDCYLQLYLASTNTNISKFQLNKGYDRRKPTLWMCDHQIINDLIVQYQHTDGIN